MFEIFLILHALTYGNFRVTDIILPARGNAFEKRISRNNA